MQARHSLTTIEIFLLCLACCIAVSAVCGMRYRYAPGVEHESAFLRNYSPKPVIESFASNEVPLGMGDGIGSGAGWKSVTNKRTIDPMFAIRADRRTPLMTALGEDVAAQLIGNGSTIISRNGDPARGFQFSYKDGTSVGSVTLLPLTDRAGSSLHIPSEDGVKEVRASIAITEKWFARESDAAQASNLGP
jgi:hypothetical protein